MSKKVWAIVIFGISLLVNGLAGTTLLGGNTTAQVSDSYPNLFAPAGITFAIWGIIYTLLAIYCVRIFRHLGRRHDKKADVLAQEVVPTFIAVSVINTLWLISWQYKVIWLSVVLIITLLALLARVNKQTHNKRLSWQDWASIKLPFSVYFGWVTVATIANITVWLVSMGWNGAGIGPEPWTVTVLIVGALVGIHNAWRLKDWAYLAVFVWAYFGIWLKHVSNTGFGGAYPAVITTLTILLGVLSFTALWFSHQWPKGAGR